jgi:hypothetical protein
VDTKLPEFEIGDFARNKIHGYTTFIFFGLTQQFYFAWSLIVDDSNCKDRWMSNFATFGTIRIEHPTELEKVPTTLDLISKAKKQLEIRNCDTQRSIDNLTYIELLDKLNTKEKELKNENEEFV